MDHICGSGWQVDDPPQAETPRTFVVAVDAGELSEKAFKCALQLMKVYAPGDSSQNDKLIVYQVTDTPEIKLQKLSENLHAHGIQIKFEALFNKLCPWHESEGRTLKQFQVSFVTEEKDGMKCADRIRGFADDNADLLLLGVFAKDAEVVDDFTRIGCINSQVPIGCKAPVLLVKSSSPLFPPKRSRRFLVTIDGSDISHCAVVAATKFMRKGDYMQLAYLQTPCGIPGGPIINKYSRWFVENKVKAACRSFKHNPDVPIAEEILDLAETGSRHSDFGGVDIIIMGSLGLSKARPNAGNEEAFGEVARAEREVAAQGSVAHSVLTSAKVTNVMTITVDALIGGSASVKSDEFSAWFEGDTTSACEGMSGHVGFQ